MGGIWFFNGRFFGEEEPAIVCETRMPFGLCTAPSMADRLISAIVRHMKSKGFTIVGYLDDFLIIANTQEECQEAYIPIMVSAGSGPPSERREVRGAYPNPSVFGSGTVHRGFYGKTRPG